MAYSSEIIRALDELIVNGAGDLFQTIATIHATQKWTQLVACEHKWDGGLDAHADGALQPDGKGIGLACSITPTIKKIKLDARETNRHYPDVKVLIFSTASKVTQHEKQQWAKEILDEFGLQLIVVSRAELINWLLDPARSDVCRDQLGIPPSMAPELEPALKSAQEAAKETADNWDRVYRKPWRPVINLKAVKLDEQGNPAEAATTDSLGAALDEGQRIVLEAPAGSGKTTTLVQFARQVLSAGGLPFLIVGSILQREIEIFVSLFSVQKKSWRMFGFLYLEAVTTVDPAEAEDVVVDLIHSQQYEHVLSQRLPLLARSCAQKRRAERIRDEPDRLQENLESASRRAGRQFRRAAPQPVRRRNP